MNKMENILTKSKVTVEEMKAYYAANFPYEPNGQRVGRFAKQIGYKLVKQMKNRKYLYFYIKDK